MKIVSSFVHFFVTIGAISVSFQSLDVLADEKTASMPMSCVLPVMCVMEWYTECMKDLAATLGELQVIAHMNCEREQEHSLYVVFGKLSFVLWLLKHKAAHELLTVDDQLYLLDCIDHINATWHSYECKKNLYNDYIVDLLQQLEQELSAQVTATDY
jgi:hypothetical protein